MGWVSPPPPPGPAGVGQRAGPPADHLHPAGQRPRRRVPPAGGGHPPHRLRAGGHVCCQMHPMAHAVLHDRGATEWECLKACGPGNGLRSPPQRTVSSFSIGAIPHVAVGSILKYSSLFLCHPQLHFSPVLRSTALQGLPLRVRRPARLHGQRAKPAGDRAEGRAAFYHRAHVFHQLVNSAPPPCIWSHGSEIKAGLSKFRGVSVPTVPCISGDNCANDCTCR